jgi:hypothetical protein
MSNVRRPTEALVEIQHEEFRRDGFFFDVQAFRLDLYRLLSAFLSTAEYARLSRGIETERLSDLAIEFQEAEITRLLVTVAATVRVIQDREGAPAKKFAGVCGHLFPDVGSKLKEPLSLREACNKIIHAKRFNFDAKPLPVADRGLPNPTYTLRPLLHLYGNQRSTEWKAELNVLQFVLANVALVHG